MPVKRLEKTPCPPNFHEFLLEFPNKTNDPLNLTGIEGKDYIQAAQELIDKIRDRLIKCGLYENDSKKHCFNGKGSKSFSVKIHNTLVYILEKAITTKGNMYKLEENAAIGKFIQQFSTIMREKIIKQMGKDTVLH